MLDESILQSPNIPPSPYLFALAGKKFRRIIAYLEISSFYLDICLSHIRFDWTEGNGRIEKEKERKEGKGKRKLVAGAYNRGDLIQDRGDLINIEEILRGLGSDYSFEEIFRGGLGRAPTFPLKGRKSGEVEKETLEEGGRKKRKAQDGGRNSDQLFPPRGLVEYA